MAGASASGPQTANAQGNGGATATAVPPPAVPAPGTPAFPWASSTAHDLPLLHEPSAWPIVRDRWERLVTTVMIPAPPERVWRALVDPDALALWLARCHGSLEDVGADVTLDFEDGEFFLVRPQAVTAPANGEPGELRWLWRWLGLGQAASVTWRLEPAGPAGTVVTATEEAFNPPADWQTWNGGGWPGILDQLAAHIRTGTSWRWPWRRMGPYVQIELAASPFEAWDALMSPAAVKFWLQRMEGDVAAGQSVVLMMGDASGTVEMAVREVVDAGQRPPSFLPSVSFGLRREAWGAEVGGHLWIEPAGLGRSLLQVFHFNWEALPAGLQLSERKLLTTFWAGAGRRASQLFQPRPQAPGGPHSWS
jgi:uncharacterized protein YndB with AHSA1/START domain